MQWKSQNSVSSTAYSSAKLPLSLFFWTAETPKTKLGSNFTEGNTQSLKSATYSHFQILMVTFFQDLWCLEGNLGGSLLGRTMQKHKYNLWISRRDWIRKEFWSLAEWLMMICFMNLNLNFLSCQVNWGKHFLKVAMRIN